MLRTEPERVCFGTQWPCKHETQRDTAQNKGSTLTGSEAPARQQSSSGQRFGQPARTSLGATRRQESAIQMQGRNGICPQRLFGFSPAWPRSAGLVWTGTSEDSEQVVPRLIREKLCGSRPNNWGQKLREIEHSRRCQLDDDMNMSRGDARSRVPTREEDSLGARWPVLFQLKLEIRFKQRSTPPS